jgi:hypothetical protein
MNWTIEGFFGPWLSGGDATISVPPGYAWIELVNGAVMVFVANLIGNTINFQGRFVNALTTAIVFAVAFSGQ